MEKKAAIIIVVFLLSTLFPTHFYAQNQVVSKSGEHLKTEQSAVEKKTNRMGRIKSPEVRIYSNLSLKSSKKAGSTFTNQVYYIKKKATIKNQTYFLISKKPSEKEGVVGWVKSSDLSSKKRSVDNKINKIFYLKGSGRAYSKPWGAKKDYIYSTLAKYEGQAFKVNSTEKIGTAIWYRGKLNNKTVWIHSQNVVEAKESKTDRMGHIRNSKVKIYQTIGSSPKTAGSEYMNSVFYIKKQSVIHKDTYYLISTKPSSVNGVVGWVHSKDISSKKRTIIDKSKKTFYIKGAGSAYKKAWGGKKDIVYQDLKKYSDQKMEVDLTEKIGNDTWYRGKLKGKTVWVKASNIKNTNNLYTKHDVTLKEAVAIQMKRSPQTDKYRNENAFIHKDFVNKEMTGVTKEKTELRTSPKLKARIDTTIKSKTPISILGTVNGDTINGNKKWYKINHKNKVLYVHSSLVEPGETIYTTTANANIMESANANSHVYATLPKGTRLNIVKEGKTWHEMKYETWRNAKASDVEEYLNPNNHSRYQHLLLSSTAGISASELNKVLKGKGSLNGLGSAFIKAGKAHKVNEIYMISHAFLETGHGTSNLAQGIEVGKDKSGKAVLVTSSNKKSLKDIKKVYNMFGIRAFDACPDTCGAAHAYEQGWDTPTKAIIGGAEFIGQQYIHNQYQQNTIYKMRWNFINPSKQYATDVGWAVKQTARIESLYKQLDNPNLEFDIPRFK